MFAGENCVTPASVIWSITLAETLEDAAPTMASTFCSQLTGDGLDRGVGRRVAGVALDEDDVGCR